MNKSCIIQMHVKDQRTEIVLATTALVAVVALFLRYLSCILVFVSLYLSSCICRHWKETFYDKFILSSVISNCYLPIFQILFLFMATDGRCLKLNKVGEGGGGHCLLNGVLHGRIFPGNQDVAVK